MAESAVVVPYCCDPLPACYVAPFVITVAFGRDGSRSGGGAPRSNTARYSHSSRRAERPQLRSAVPCFTVITNGVPAARDESSAAFDRRCIPPAALLLGHILPVFSFVVPYQTCASPHSVPRQIFTTDC